MNDQEKLYALALALVDDPDAAGDLFMDASGEADLLRRAARWRRRHGLPEAPAGVTPVPLTPDLKEHAAHLARRARLRRGMKAGVAIALSVVAAVLLALDLTGVTNLTAYAERGLAADPVYRGQPIATAQDLTIYKTDATPGSITIWWSVQGRDAAAEAKASPLSLTFWGGKGSGPAIQEETAAPRPDKVVGKSTFRAPVVQTMPVLVTAGSWKAQVLVDPQPEAGARSVPVGKMVPGLGGQVKITVESVTLGSTYTEIHYQLDGAETNTALAYLVDASVDTHHLDRYGPMRRGLPDGERVMVFGPVPPGAGALELRFPRLVQNGTVPSLTVSLGN